MNISSRMRQRLTGKHSADMALRLKAAQIRQLYSQSRLGIFGAIVGALVLTAALWNEVPSWKLLAWLAPFVPLQVWRQHLLISYFRASPAEEDSVAWERRFLIGSVSTACLWGSAGILLFPENRIVEQCFFGVILGGVSASTAMAHSPVRACYVSSVLLAIVPFLVRLLWEGETMPVFLGLVGFGFLAAILGTGMSAHQLLVKSIILASEKDEFLQKLKGAQDNLETQVAERTTSLIEANEKLQSEVAERRRFEAALRESEEQYRMLVEHANEGIFLSQSGKPVFVNKACCNLTGYSEQELLSKEFVELVHPDDQRQIIERYERRLQGDETPYSYTVRILARDGNTKWVHVNSASVKWKGINSILGFFTDITDRVLAEESMVQERRKFQILAENAPFGMIMLDEDDNFMYANPMFMEMFGYDMNEVPNGKAWLEKAYPDPQYRKEVIQSWFSDAKASKIEEPRPRTFTVTCKDGRRKSIHFMSVQLETGQHLVACEDVTLRKKLEEERDLLFSLSMDMLCVAGFDGFFKQVNPAWTKTLGWSAEKLLSKPWIELVHPDDREDSLRAGRKLLSGEPVYDFENRYMCKDGSCRWMSWNSFPLIDEERIFAVVRDMTDRKNAESALAENQSRLKAIQDHLPDMLWMKDFEGRFLLVNKAFATACGRPSAEDVVGKTDFDIWSKNLARLYTADDQNVMANGTSKLVEEPIVDQGVTKWFETFKTPLFDANGAVVGTIGSARDITHRKTVEQALRQSEEKYRKILETIADGYHEVDLKGNLTLVNDSLCDILGYSRDELIGKNYLELMDERNTQEILHAYNEVFRSGISNPEFCYQVFRKDGTMRDVSVSIALIRDSAGSPIGFRGIFRDISERRHLEEQLRQAVKMEAIGRLAGGIAHDFNNLLTAILGYTTMVRLEVPEEESARRKLDQISRAAERAADLTRQLLAFSRKQVLEVITINYNDLVRDIESMLRRIIGEDVELITELGKDIGNVRADQTQLEQVIVNLAVNSRDAMPRGGTLTIETVDAVLDESYCASHTEVKPGKYVLLCISDTGHGMTPETCNRAFDPFFTTKAKGVGTGLGLSTVYGIIKQHGGHVAIYSEPGQGTSFKVYLPRVEESVNFKLPGKEMGDKPQGHETILLVEDEETVRDLAAEALEMLGYKILKADSPLEAIDISDTNSGTIHLLLTDVVLPQMDGKTLYQTLAKSRPELKVLYVSGYTENFIVHRGILDHEVSFLQKPFTLDSIARKVRSVLDM